jgi:hypothetical protein
VCFADASRITKYLHSGAEAQSLETGNWKPGTCDFLCELVVPSCVN